MQIGRSSDTYLFRHQILLKATAMGLKESTTRGTKRRRGDEAGGEDQQQHRNPHPPTPVPAPAPVPTPTAPMAPITAIAPASTYVSHPSAGVSPGHSSATANSNPPSANASPATQNRRPPSAQQVAAPRTPSSSLPFPMPVTASNMSPIITSNDPNDQRNPYYRQNAYPGGLSLPSPSSQRPPSSHGRTTTTHPYMYSPSQSNATVRRD